MAIKSLLQNIRQLLQVLEMANKKEYLKKLLFSMFKHFKLLGI